MHEQANVRFPEPSSSASVSPSVALVGGASLAPKASSEEASQRGWREERREVGNRPWEFSREMENDFLSDAQAEKRDAFVNAGPVQN